MVIPLKIFCDRCGAQYPKEFDSEKHDFRVFRKSPLAQEIRENNWFIHSNNKIFTRDKIYCSVCWDIMDFFANMEKHDSDDWCNKGSELLGLGRFEEALQAIYKAIKLNFDNVNALRLKEAFLTQVLQEIYRTRPEIILGCGTGPNGRCRAVSAINKYLELWPDDYFAWRNKSEALYDLDQHKKALEEIEKTLELKPDDSNSWREKAKSLNNLGRFEEALQAIEKAIELHPDDLSGLRIKTVVLEEALAAIDNCIVVTDNSNAKQKRDVLLEEVLLTIEKVIELNPNDSNAWRERARALNNFGHYEEALQAIDKYLQIHPDDSFAWKIKFSTLSNLDRNEEALQAIDKAIELSPDDSYAWRAKASELEMLERYREANTARKKAFDLNMKSK